MTALQLVEEALKGMSEKALSAELKAKYPKAKHAPDPDCPKCEGKGEWWNPTEGRFIKPAFVPCVCIFVSHDLVGLARETLGATVRKLKAELDGKG